MGTNPPSGPQPISATRAGAAGSDLCTNGHTVASHRSSDVTLTERTPPPKAAQPGDHTRVVRPALGHKGAQRQVRQPRIPALGGICHAAPRVGRTERRFAFVAGSPCATAVLYGQLRPAAATAGRSCASGYAGYRAPPATQAATM